MEELDQKTLEYIFSNLTVIGYILGPWGGQQEPLRIDDIQKYRDNYREFCADHHGLSLEQFEHWMETDGTPRCGEKTKRGKRCKKPCGRSHSPAKQWLEEDGGICAYHENVQWRSRYLKR